MNTNRYLSALLIPIILFLLQGCSGESDRVLKYIKANGAILSKLGESPKLDMTGVDTIDEEEAQARLDTLDERKMMLSEIVEQLEKLETPPSCEKYSDLSKQAVRNMIQSNEEMRNLFVSFRDLRANPSEEQLIESELEQLGKTTDHGQELLSELENERARLMKEHGLVFKSEQ